MPRGKPFPKGKSGNPGGRKPESPELKALRETSHKEFLQGMQKYGHLTRAQMAKELQKPNLTMFELMFGQIVASAAKGDKDARQVLLDRLWGKVKEQVQVENITSMTDAELLEASKEAIKVLESKK